MTNASNSTWITAAAEQLKLPHNHRLLAQASWRVSDAGDTIKLTQEYEAYRYFSSAPGEKHQGFDVLYHNMKHGQTSIKSLQDFIRESAVSEDSCSKNLSRLAKLTASFSPVGTFAPMFEPLKTVAEKLSSCHMDIVHKLHDLSKELAKYLEEQKIKHKQVKEEMSATSSALQQLQNATASVQKHKEKYHQCCIEIERLRRISAVQKEIEKAEVKVKKSEDEYRSIVEKYANLRDDYEDKMTDSAKKFQDLEAVHLDRMRKILESYVLSYENGNVLMGQVHQEFRRQIDEKTTQALIKQYSDSKGTGTLRPEAVKFEECDLDAALNKMDLPQSDAAVADPKSPPPSTTRLGLRPSLNLPFRRKKTRKSTKTSVSEVKDVNSPESPEKDSGFQVDEEGYTIRPESPKDLLSNHKGSSDSSDSDWDDSQTRKIHVKINPKDENTVTPTDNNLDALNEITKSLTLSSPILLGSRKLTRNRSSRSSGISEKSSLTEDTEWLSKKADSFFTDLPIPEYSISSESTEDTHLPETVRVSPKILAPPKILLTLPESDPSKRLRAKSVFLPRNDSLLPAEDEFADVKNAKRPRSQSIDDIALRAPDRLAASTHTSLEVLPSNSTSDSESFITATSGSSNRLNHVEKDSSNTDNDIYVMPSESQTSEETIQQETLPKQAWVDFEEKDDALIFRT